MADKQRTESTSIPQLKMLLLGGVAVVSTVISVVLSQPHFAVASIDSELRLVAGADTALSGPRALVSRQQDNPIAGRLFWNPLTKSWLTDEQAVLMQTAYEIGLADGGAAHGELLQAVLLQETIAGQLGRIGHMTAPVGKRSYGVMQVKVSAARDVLRRHEAFGRFRSDEELIVALMSDDVFNMRIASKFLLHLKNHTHSEDAALVAYNIGLRASRKIAKPTKFKYVVRTRRNLTEVVQHFNQTVGQDLQLAANAG
ncbi:hypothetical protein Tel_07830 [Candidatus Tenderia electrophaga]|jgi:hypothetical protein|uniref:Transglycosylase SLT domain-containing protein n=1 Tax=Candidatus Tenderia electrophaga TaxID=1748243 RepID=A0A0S2TD56_9GAMM|nr:hypothetical protein Tel_07830 [Candidatus Tenderia electrophaga]